LTMHNRFYLEATMARFLNLRFYLRCRMKRQPLLK
jgi:hypothetical protein